MCWNQHCSLRSSTRTQQAGREGRVKSHLSDGLMPAGFIWAVAAVIMLELEDMGATLLRVSITRQQKGMMQNDRGAGVETADLGIASRGGNTKYQPFAITRGHGTCC